MVTFGCTTAIPHILSSRFEKFVSKLSFETNFSTENARLLLGRLWVRRQLSRIFWPLASSNLSENFREPNFSIGGGRKCEIVSWSPLDVPTALPHILAPRFEKFVCKLAGSKFEINYPSSPDVRRCQWFAPPANAHAHRRGRVVTFPG